MCFLSLFYVNVVGILCTKNFKLFPLFLYVFYGIVCLGLIMYGMY